MCRIARFLLMLITIPRLVSCVEEIPFTTGKGARTVVLSGGINNLDEDQVVFLSRTQEEGQPALPESGAVIYLVESSGQTWLFYENREGRYILPAGSVVPEIGASYHVEFTLADGGLYRSIPEILLPVVQPDSVRWKIGKETTRIEDGKAYSIDALQLFISTGFAVDQPDTYFRWIVHSAFEFTTLPECSPFRTTTTCYFSDLLNPGLFFLYDNRDNPRGVLRNFPIGYESLEPNYRYSETHYFSIYQHRISQKAFEYFSRLNRVAVQNGSIFDPIPASVKGNLYRVDNENEKVLGYFQVSSAAVIRQRIIRADLDGKYNLLDKRNNLCGLLVGVFGSEYFEGCCNCYSIKYPIIDKPAWW